MPNSWLDAGISRIGAMASISSHGDHSSRKRRSSYPSPPPRLFFSYTSASLSPLPPDGAKHTRPK
ncbi:hypothetical protein [Chromobacterium vaccinii]|uniref:hypothetical protein n=1 Tax=Chromobacterium vaccinii TaxID=1108595 RepID=UPI0021B25075|nr:hypothetical protein [Chromobacterium vaccinii]